MLVPPPQKKPCRPQRWALHYELQLFERALRHTGEAAGSPGQSGAAAGQSGAGRQHPFAPHLEWSLGAIAGIVRCLHGLQVRGVPAWRLPLPSAALFGSAASFDPCRRGVIVAKQGAPAFRRLAPWAPAEAAHRLPDSPHPAISPFTDSLKPPP